MPFRLISDLIICGYASQTGGTNRKEFDSIVTVKAEPFRMSGGTAAHLAKFLFRIFGKHRAKNFAL